MLQPADSAIISPLPAVHRLQGGAALAVAIGGNLFLVWLFVRALLSPLEHVAFIHQAFLLILIETLSIHASIAFNELRAGRSLGHDAPSSPFGVVTLFAAIAILLGYAFGNYALPLFFVVGLGAKAFANRAAPPESKFVANLPFFVLFFSILSMIPLMPVFQSHFPFPAEFFTRKIEGVLGELTNTLQYDFHGPLAWGIVYFSLLAILEAVLFWRKKRKLSRVPSTTETS